MDYRKKFGFLKKGQDGASFELFLLKWVILSLLIALILGGRPWKFPAGGKFWINSVKSTMEHRDSYP